MEKSKRWERECSLKFEIASGICMSEDKGKEYICISKTKILPILSFYSVPLSGTR